MRKIAVAAVLAAVTLAGAPAAVADPVTGGKTVLKPDADTLEGLADMSIGVETSGTANSGNNGFKFPISGGDLNDGPLGEIAHRGGLIFFTEGGPGMKVSKFELKIGANKAKLFGNLEGDRIRFADVNLSDATIGGSAGVNLKIRDAETTLAKAGAEAMSEVFDFPFRKGIPLGTLKVNAQLTS